MTTQQDDIRYMQYALRLSERGLGRTAPNPSVGCVIVKHNKIIAAARTADKGRPHAETEALAQIGREAHGSTVYVTLEPCNHEGKAGACAKALVDARVERVVIAMEDPFGQVMGQGIETLKAAGIKVEVGLCGDEARKINAGFLLNIEEQRPFVTLKLAATLDGKLATSDGKSKWITGEDARHYAHSLRYSHDAVMVGIGTALEDDPTLNCRLAGLKNHSPIRVILDSKLRMPEKAKCVKSAKKTKTYIFTTRDAGEDARQPAKVVKVKADATNHVDLKDTMKHLAEMGVTRLLVEGGSTLAASLLKADLVDQLVWINSTNVMGGSGMPAVANINARFEKAALQHKAMFELSEDRYLGDDHVTVLKRTA